MDTGPPAVMYGGSRLVASRAKFRTTVFLSPICHSQTEAQMFVPKGELSYVFSRGHLMMILKRLQTL